MGARVAMCVLVAAAAAGCKRSPRNRASAAPHATAATLPADPAARLAELSALAASIEASLRAGRADDIVASHWGAHLQPQILGLELGLEAEGLPATMLTFFPGRPGGAPAVADVREEQESAAARLLARKVGFEAAELDGRFAALAHAADALQDLARAGRCRELTIAPSSPTRRFRLFPKRTREALERWCAAVAGLPARATRINVGTFIVLVDLDGGGVMAGELSHADGEPVNLRLTYLGR